MVGSRPPHPSLAPLTELNELSTLSVLEESSWERAGGWQGWRGGEGGQEGRERDKGKEFRGNPALKCCPTFPLTCKPGSSASLDSQARRAWMQDAGLFLPSFHLGLPSSYQRKPWAEFQRVETVLQSFPVLS